MSVVVDSDYKTRAASEAITLQAQINELSKRLAEQKAILREIANGTKCEIVVENTGKVNISVPTESKSQEVIVVNEQKLTSEMKTKLFSEGVLKQEMKHSPAQMAKVTIRPNV